MHPAADPVTHEVAHDREAVALHVILDRLADVEDPVADFCKLDPFEEGLTGDFHQFLRLFADLAHGIGARAVSDETLPGRAEIDGHDIAVVHGPPAGDPVNDFIVDGHAGRRRKAFIAQTAGHGAGLDDELMHRPIDLPGRHAVLDGLAAHGSCAGRDLRGLTHDLDLMGRFDGYALGHVQISRTLRMTTVVSAALG